MNRSILFAVAVIFAASLVLAQAGPKEQTKKKKKARPDTTKVEPKKAKAKPKPETKPKPKPETKLKPKPEAKPQSKPEAKPSPVAKPQSESQPERKVDVVAPGQPPPPPARTPRHTPLSANIRRAVFATAIEAHEPAGTVDSLSTQTERVYFFTELVGLNGALVTHRWLHEGVVRAEVPINVRSARFRAASSKTLLPEWTGEWTVEVVDSTQSVLGSKRFVYYRAVRN